MNKVTIPSNPNALRKIIFLMPSGGRWEGGGGGEDFGRITWIQGNGGGISRCRGVREGLEKIE